MIKIDVVPFGGLGNRLRVLNSALFLGKEVESEIRLFWFKKSELYASFYKLFRGCGFRVTVVRGLLYYFAKLLLKHIYIQKYPQIYRLFLSLFYDKVLFDIDLKNSNGTLILNEILSSKRVLIATCYEFFPFSNFNNFILNPEIQNSIDSFQISRNYIGVHVRMSDHVEIRNESSIQNYIDAIDFEIQKDNQIQLYLSTDDAQIKQFLKDKYSKRIKTQDVSLVRDSEIGIIGAIIDIYNLSRCSKIICNPKSSFAVMASRLGSPKTIIKV